MSGVLAILRLLRRPAAPWNLLVFAVIALLAGRVAWNIQPLLDPAACTALGPIERGWQIATLLFAGGTGSFVGWTLGELLLTPQAPLLPDLARKLHRGLIGLGAASATVATLAYEGAAGAQPWAVVLALGACAFGVGAWAVDPILPRGSGWAVLLAASTALVWLPRILHTLTLEPLAGSAALLAFGAVGLRHLLRAGALRRRPELSAMDLGIAYRSDAATVNWTTAGTRGQRLRVRLPRGRTEGQAGWMRAAFLENFGWTRGGVAGALLGQAFFWSAFLFGIGLVQTALHPDQGLLPIVDGLFESPEAGSGIAGLVAATSAVFWVSNSLTLRTTTGYPLSREQRARALWRAALVANAGLHLALALVLLVVSVLLVRFAGVAWRPPGPGFARVLALSLLAAPLVQGARLRWIDLKGRAPTSLELGLLTGIAVVALVVAVVVGADAWQALFAGVAPDFQWLGALLLFAAVQLLWRARLVRRFATCELPA